MTSRYSASTDTPVYVFNCGYNGLAIIQALGRKGVPVRALDSKRDIGTWSRYATFQRVADPSVNERAFVEQLMQIGKEEDRKPLLWPTNDQWAEAIARNAALLGESFVLCTTSDKVIDLLLDKERFGIWCERQGLRAPESWSAEEASAAADSLPYPIAVKANSRRRAGQAEIGGASQSAIDRFRFVPCRNKEELLATIAAAREQRIHIFAQKIVKGRSSSMRSIGLYARSGRLKGIMYGRKIRGYPPDFGDCIVGQAEAVPSWAEDLAVQVCSALDYTGIAEIELMEDADTGVCELIEINPRSWSWIGVCEPAGVDLPWLAYKDLILGQEDERLVRSCQNKRTVFYVKALEDFENCVLWYRFTSATDWVRSPLAWWKWYIGANRVTAEFAKDDKWILIFAIWLRVRANCGRALKACLRIARLRR